MQILKVLSFAIAVTTILAVAEEPKNEVPAVVPKDWKCPYVNFYGAESLTYNYTRSEKERKFCKSVNNTCCSSDDFSQIEAYWESSLSKISNFDLKALEMKTLITIAKKLIKYEDIMYDKAVKIKEAVLTSQPVCSSPAFILGNIFKLGLIKTGVKHYIKSASVCWDYTKNLLNAMMCASCDYDAQKKFISDKKRIQISLNQCFEFTDACKDHLKSLNAITFYLSYYYRLTFCNDKGEFEGDIDGLSMDSKLIQAINSCIKEKNPDDCSEVCRSQFGFSSMTVFENKEFANIYVGGERLDQALEEEWRKNYANVQKKHDDNAFSFDNIEDLRDSMRDKIKDIAAKKNRELASEVDPQKHEKTPNTVVRPVFNLETFGVEVTNDGLNLTSYTAENADNYAAVSLDRIFGEMDFMLEMIETLSTVSLSIGVLSLIGLMYF